MHFLEGDNVSSRFLQTENQEPTINTAYLHYDKQDQLLVLV